MARHDKNDHRKITGYEIIAICNTKQGAKRAITWYLKD